MAKKNEKISISAFEKAVKDIPQSCTVDWNGIEITIRNTISLNEMVDFVSVVYNSCFSSDGEYMPEAWDLAFRSEVINKYTNITLSASINKRYEMLYATDVFDTVRSHINCDQLDAIDQAILNKIGHRRAMDISDFEKRQDKILRSFEALQAQFEKLFGSVTNEDIKTILSAAGAGGFDENKLAKALLEQKYKESDALS